MALLLKTPEKKRVTNREMFSALEMLKDDLDKLNEEQAVLINELRSFSDSVATALEEWGKREEENHIILVQLFDLLANNTAVKETVSKKLAELRGNIEDRITGEVYS